MSGVPVSTEGVAVEVGAAAGGTAVAVGDAIATGVGVDAGDGDDVGLAVVPGTLVAVAEGAVTAVADAVAFGVAVSLEATVLTASGEAVTLAAMPNPLEDGPVGSLAQAAAKDRPNAINTTSAVEERADLANPKKL